MTLLRWLVCQLLHRGCDVAFVRNIYGDEIIISGFNRSVWQCRRCRSTTANPLLVR